MDQLYCLKVNNVPKYIGRTKLPISERLRQHKYEALSGCNTTKCLELATALKKNKEVTIELLETIDVTAPHTTEDKIINQYRLKGYDLWNTAGGDTGAQYRHTKLVPIGTYVDVRQLKKTLVNDDMSKNIVHFNCNGWVGRLWKGSKPQHGGWFGLVYDRNHYHKINRCCDKSEAVETIVKFIQETC
jgi:hypothetical protein